LLEEVGREVPMHSEKAISEFENSRLNRVVRIILTCAAAWTGFGIYYGLTGRTLAGAHCVFEGLVVGVGCALAAYRRPEKRTEISKFYVASIIVGLTVDTCFGGLQRALAPMFFCAAVLVATLILGHRYARKWILISILLILAINYVLPFVVPATPDPLPLDRMLGYVTLLGVISSCAFIAESSAEAFAQRLELATSELRAQTVALNRLVGVDSLTSLKNRRQLHEDSQKLVNAKSPASGFALLLIDLNDFKLINDRYGHVTGDNVLREFARRLLSILCDVGKVYRIGGDEFVAIVPSGRKDLMLTAQRAAKRILTTVSTDFVEGGRNSKLGVSVGIALYPNHANTVDELISCADKAMYEAKGSTSSVVVFESRMAEEVEEKRLLSEHLDLAIENDEFLLFYQPQVDLATNQIVGVEALIRWQRDGEMISPFHFIPSLETSGKIIEVGSWVLRTGCEQIFRWRLAGFDIRLSVNVSSLQIQQPSFASDVLELLDEFGLPASALDLEVTESLLLEYNERTQKNIERLTERNVQFSIDDFGTGYSSLAYLKRLTVDRLKIDRSFIKDIPDDDDGVIAETVITLGKQLGMTIVAEGVETELQRDFLRQRGCDEFQGYLFSKPVSAEDCRDMLENQFSADTIETEREMLAALPATLNK